MNLQLQDKVIMIAASSRGLGYGIAEAVAREGARLSLGSRSAGAIQGAAAGIQQEFNTEARGYVLDAKEAKSIQNWIDSTLKDFGRIDGLVINAGGPPPGNFDKFDDNAWADAFELTLMSAVRMVRGVLPAMRKQRSGSILAITSSSIKEPIDNLILSNVLRSGVASLLKSLSFELAPDGIRVNNLVPGRIDTDRVRSVDKLNADKKGIPVEEQQRQQWGAIPLGRYGTIQETGNAAAFLLSDAASYITGTTIVVDGGKTRSIN